MSTDSIAISRDLVAAGLERKIADAVAQKIVAHADENHATKTDMVRLEGRINTLETKVNILIGLNAAVFLFLLTNAIGGG